MTNPGIRKITFIWIILLAYILPGCSGNEHSVSSALQESFATMIPVKDMNQSLRVTILYSNQNNPKFVPGMNVVVENMSATPIYFQDNPSPIRLYIAQGDKWIEVKNNATLLSYQGNPGFVLSPKNTAANVWTPPVVPSLAISQDAGKGQEDLRILVIGEVVLNGQKTGNLVGAYVDTLIAP